MDSSQATPPASNLYIQPTHDAPANPPFLTRHFFLASANIQPKGGQSRYMAFIPSLFHTPHPNPSNTIYKRYKRFEQSVYPFCTFCIGVCGCKDAWGGVVFYHIDIYNNKNLKTIFIGHEAKHTKAPGHSNTDGLLYGFCLGQNRQKPP